MARWQRRQAAAGRGVAFTFDALALTFVVSSWNFDWQAGVEFGDGVRSAHFEHGALALLVANFTPRPVGDGLDVLTAGPEGALRAAALRAALLAGAVARAHAATATRDQREHASKRLKLKS